MQKQLKPIIKRISLRLNIPEVVVEAAVRSQFECARKELQVGKDDDETTFKNIRFKHLGILAMNKKKLEKVLNNRKKRNNE